LYLVAVLRSHANCDENRVFHGSDALNEVFFAIQICNAARLLNGVEVLAGKQNAYFVHRVATPPETLALHSSIQAIQAWPDKIGS
jgi:hypothetical protein